MDGLAYLPHAESTVRQGATAERVSQRSIASAIACRGIGVHSGRTVLVRLRPAPAGHGIVFRRTDLDVSIPARFDLVGDTRLCTVLGAGEARIGTVEHLMAALAALGVDNLLVEVDGPELPILDGSAEPWLFLLDCAGIAVLEAPRRSIAVLRTVRVEENGAFAELRPIFDGSDAFDLAMSIEFDAAAIGAQQHRIRLEPGTFRREIARARTFAQRHEIEGLRAAGLARGGSLDNAIVVDGDAVLNPAGLRMQGEFVRHKLLDAVGDLALAGARLQARFTGHRSGHALNNRLLRALFADATNYRVVGAAPALLAA